MMSHWHGLSAGYEDNGAYWRSWYESDTFRQECEQLWNEVRPLYEQLHAYVRRKLQERYPDGTFPAEGHIPAHLLGALTSIYAFLSQCCTHFRIHYNIRLHFASLRHFAQ